MNQYLFSFSYFIENFSKEGPNEIECFGTIVITAESLAVAEKTFYCNPRKPKGNVKVIFIISEPVK